MRIENKKAHFNYELGERWEAGLVLSGPEVKSAKAGQLDLGNSFCKIMPTRFGAREVWVFNLMIFPYQHADNEKYEPTRKRKLLLHQKEVVSIESKMKQGRLLLVPVAMYLVNGKLKLEVALARGKRIFEKRETIKKRDLDRGRG